MKSSNLTDRIAIESNPDRTTSLWYRSSYTSALRVCAAGLALSATTTLAAAQARGDFNGDGRSDLAIGIPGATAGGIYEAGEVVILAGTSSGLSANIVQTLNQDSAGMPGAAEPSDHFGAALAAGDFDGDGYDDLVIGVPNEDVVENDAGAIHVLYGTFLGLSPSGSQMLWESSIGQLSENGDQFGAALATGDINGDGYDDLVVGVPYEDVGSTYNAGAIIVIFGSSSGLRTTGTIRLHQESTDVAGGSERWDKFGVALTVADFDGDGYDDIVAGVPNEGVNGKTYAGAVAVLYGAASGPSGSRDALWHRDDSGMIGSAASNEYFGSAVTSGDYNNDGYADLAVGAWGRTVSGFGAAGSVCLLLGSARGLTSTGNQLWHQDSAGIGGAAEANDGFGGALTTGDFDRDGYDDLVVGVRGEDIGGIVDAGMVHVIKGFARGLTATGSQTWHQDTSGVDGGSEMADRFGSSLAAGDFNGDGRDDLAIGVPEEDIDSRVNAGAVNILYAATTGGLSATGDLMVYRGYGRIPGSPASSEEFGAAIASAR